MTTVVPTRWVGLGWVGLGWVGLEQLFAEAKLAYFSVLFIFPGELSAYFFAEFDGGART
ncbi:MAG: hypothetical protein V3V08_10385 [Nannocystaceae bacterium]